MRHCGGVINRRRRMVTACGALVCVLTVTPHPTAASAGQSPERLAAPTFARDIAPLLSEHCVSCHRPGGAAPFSLLTYEDVRPRARQVVAAVSSQRMPPWKPSGDAGVFEGERRLSAQQVSTFGRWLDTGALLGDRADMQPMVAPSGEWAMGTPDVVLRLPTPYSLAPGGPDRLRNFVVPIPISTPRDVRAWEFRTTNLRVVHHATMMVDRGGAARALDPGGAGGGWEGLIPFSAQSPDGYFLGWTPGQQASRTSPEFAWRIEPGDNLIVMLHLRPDDRPELVDARVALYFSDTPATRTPVMIRLNRQDLDIPAAVAAYEAVDHYTLPVDVDVLAIQPHAHYLARSVTTTATLPDGRTVTLLDVPQWDFHWQDVYRYRQPLRLPAGTALTMRFSFDNSSGNRANPTVPPQRVFWGQRSTDEMADVWLQVVPARDAERARLVADLRRKLIPQHMAGYRRMLAVDPANASLHDDLALLAWESNDRRTATDEFRTSVQLRPNSASAHYNLGNALLAQGQFAPALSAFLEAIRLEATHGLSHQGLGLALAAMHRVDEGVAALEDAVRLMPTSADARYNLGVLRQQQGRTDAALEAFEQAAALPAGHPGASYGAALLREARGEYEGALRHLRRALLTRPDWALAETELAWLLAVAPDASMRRVEESVVLARHALAGAGETARGLDVLAAALAASGRYDDAVAQASRAIERASANNDRDHREAIVVRRALYQARQPFVLPPPTPQR